MHGPMKTTFAVGSEYLIRRAASTIGETDEETYWTNSGKFFSMNATKDGQQDVVSILFSFHSLTS